MNETPILTYTKNGDTMLNSSRTINEAKRRLRALGYKKAFIGRYYFNNCKTIVGIDENNKVGIEERRKNGLKYAREIKL